MRKFAFLGLTVMLAACGGGGGSGGTTTSTAVGYFKDSNTQGVRYVSGAQSGVTGTDGSFTYEVGRPVYFYIGEGTNVPLGSVAVGQAVVTPVDLVASAATTHQAVQNLTRFLMMLDKDDNASNGITISPEVQRVATTWTAPDFSLAEGSFNTNTAVNNIKNSVGTADARTPRLQNAATARSHVEATLRCARSGGFKGSYSGGDTGVFGVLVDAATGNVDGLGYSNSLAQVLTITGTSPMSLDQNANFTSGVTSTLVTYTGRMTSANTVAGTWANTTLNGDFSGTRVGGSLAAKYRFTGRFQNAALTSYGLYTFDIDASNSVTGLAYDIPSGTTEALSGDVTNNGATLSSNAGSAVSFSATINLAAGTLTGGLWTKGSLGGSFTASGCQLN